MKKTKLVIVIIDDGINMELLHKLRAKNSNINCYNCNRQYITPVEYINHGTVCASILLETMENKGIIDSIELISISVLDKDKKYNLQKLLDAIQWGIDHKVDLINMSIGSKEFIAADRLIKVSKMAKEMNVIIVAAGANDGMITYPACLPYVIGVKVADEALKNEGLHEKPIDGIDIVAYVPKLNVLKALEQDFGYSLQIANSLLAPIITAEIACVLLKKEKALNITDIKKLIAKEKNIKLISDSCSYPPLNTEININDERQIPIIAIEYQQVNKKNHIKLVKALQKELINKGYSCAFISDTFTESSYEKNRFKLLSCNVEEWLYFYFDFLNTNIILLLIEKEEIKSIKSPTFIDAIITEEEGFFNCPSYQLKSTDSNLVFLSIYKWIIDLFHN